jgi:peptidyl-tRNA hydrolase
MDRLYVLVRSDLNPGLAMAQACHAVAAFAAAYPEECAHWKAGGNNLVCLSVPSEGPLRAMAARSLERGALVTVFTEPDLHGQATAVAISGEAKATLRQLPLALKPAA